MIEFNNISIKQGNFNLSSISFNLLESKYYCMVGKTGSGKTTLLEILCGLRKFDSGDILINGENISYYKAGERGIGYVPQDIVLFNQMSVYDNIGFSLKVRKINNQIRDKRISEISELLGISKLLNRKPNDLSGGEKQRVAIGRAICFYPNILLLDEPFTALDEETKQELYDLVKIIQFETKVTILHVTHNTNEVKYLADYIIELKNSIITVSDKREFIQKEKIIFN